MGFQGRESSSHRGGRNHQHLATSNFKGSHPSFGPRSEAGGPQCSLRGRRAEIGALEAAQGLGGPGAGLFPVGLRAAMMFSSPARGRVALAWAGT